MLGVCRLWHNMIHMLHTPSTMSDITTVTTLFTSIQYKYDSIELHNVRKKRHSGFGCEFIYLTGKGAIQNQWGIACMSNFRQQLAALLILTVLKRKWHRNSLACISEINIFSHTKMFN